MLHSIAYLAATGLGIAFGAYLALNSMAARALDSAILANVSFFAFGLGTAVFIALFAGHSASDLNRFSGLPWWMYLSGVASGLMILGSAFLIPLIGPAPFFVLFVAGQVLIGAFIGHFGWFRLAPDAASPQSLIGLVLVIFGAWLVTGN